MASHMLYKVTMTTGHVMKFRDVLTFDYDASKSFFVARLDGWRKVQGSGVASISIEEDVTPSAPSFEIVGPDEGGESTISVADEAPEIFRRESTVTRELATKTFAPMEVLH